MSRVALIDSGLANLASMERALKACGAPVERTVDPMVVAQASHVVLPGVGSFAAGVAALESASLIEPLRRRTREDRPLLAVCLGMQILGTRSEEGGGSRGLGIFPATFTALPESAGVPHLGWNLVSRVEEGGAVEEGFAAFANSYALSRAPLGWRAAWTHHGVPFVASLSRGRVLATQFHPELSGAWGFGVIRDWLTASSQSMGQTSRARPGLRRRIVPCLDVANGRVVKGVRFKELRDAGDPAGQAALYAAQGADELVLLDITASPESRGHRLETVRAVRERLDIPLTVGGGVATLDDARDLLAAGADRVAVNSAALARPGLLGELASAFGRQCVVVAIDAKRGDEGWEALACGGRQGSGREAVDWAQDAVSRGAGEVLLTSWDRDGTRAGCDLELIEVVSRRVSTPVIASGGVGSREDVRAAFGAGADAVLAASIFHDDLETVATVKNYLAEHGVEVRQ